MMLIRKRVEQAAGKVCEALLPINQEYYLGRGKTIAICTLSSIDLLDLLEAIARPSLMNKLLITGRLLSENKGIDAIVAFAMKHPELKLMVMCGKEVKDHRAGQALMALASNGVDSSGRIIGALGPNPIVTSCAFDVEIFRRQIQLIDLIGTVDIGKIAQALVS
jgi:tetrahydromethanopterin S-methyltransferase subunit A